MAEVKKKWIGIIAPRILNNAEIGETIMSDSNKIIGKTVEANVGFINNDMRRQHMKLTLKIKEIKNNIANTEIIDYHTVKAHIKRSMRKGRSKIEDSFVVECKDKIKVRIKPFLVTRYKTNRSVLTDLKKNLREFILNYCKKLSFEELIKSVIINGLQRDIKKGLKKIFPIAFSEIRILKKV